MAGFLHAPPFVGVLLPLSAQPPLPSSLQRADPNLKIPPLAAGADSGASSMMGAINRMRQQQGRPPFQDLPVELADRNRSYLRPVLQGILASGNCEHDQPRWQAFQSSLTAVALNPSSEVLACAGSQRKWNPEAVLADWLSSAHHRAILLDRPRATNLGCSTLSQGGRTVVICTLWSPSR